MRDGSKKGVNDLQRSDIKKKAIDLNKLSAVDGKDLKHDISYLEFKEFMHHFRGPAKGIKRVGKLFANLFRGGSVDKTTQDIESGKFYKLDPKTGKYKRDKSSQETGKDFVERQKFGNTKFSEQIEEFENKFNSALELDDDMMLQVSFNSMDPRVLEYKLNTDKKFTDIFKGVISKAHEANRDHFLTDFQNILHILMDYKKELGIEIQNKQILSDGKEELLTHQIAGMFGTKDRQDLMVRLHEECGISLTEKDKDGNNIFHVMANDMRILKHDQSRDPRAGMKYLIEKYPELGMMSMEPNNKGLTAVQIMQEKADKAAGVSQQDFQPEKQDMQPKQSSKDAAMKDAIKEVSSKLPEGTTVGSKWDESTKESKVEREKQKKESSVNIGAHRS